MVERSYYGVGDIIKRLHIGSGKRKLSKEPLSERALKHVKELTAQSRQKKCILLFIIQRTDINRFCISKLDPTYKEDEILFCQNSITPNLY